MQKSDLKTFYKRAEELSELIHTIYESEPVQYICGHPGFYYEKALGVFSEFQSFHAPEVRDEKFKQMIENGISIGFYDKLILDFDEFQKNGGNFGEFLKKQNPESPEHFTLFIIGRLVAYLDRKAYNIRDWNEYEDNRAVALASVRQPYWIINLLRYKATNHDLNAVRSINIRNALKYILDPAHEPNILSKNHRRLISEKLLMVNYNENDFSKRLFAFFDYYQFSLKDESNRGLLYARITYDPKIREIWDSFKKPDTIKAQTENDFEEISEEALIEEQEKETSRKIITDITGIAVALTDREAEKDYLGRNLLVETIAAMIASPKQETPFTIGIFGDWGAGKSSLMKLIVNSLKEKEYGRAKEILEKGLNKKCVDKIKDQKKRDEYIKKIIEKNKPKLQDSYKKAYDFAEFNAWEHEHLDNIHAGFAQKIVEGLTINLSGFWARLVLRIRFANSEYKTKFWFALTLLTLLVISESLLIFKIDVTNLIKTILGLSGASIILYTIRALKKVFEHPLSTDMMTYLKLPEYGEHLGLIPILQRHLKTLTKIRLRNGRKLIARVDDLDRCKSENIVKILEAIRLVMNLNNVVVIIAIDSSVALRAIARAYCTFGDDSKPETEIPGDYLGKIIQLPVHLDKPADKEIAHFINKVLFNVPQEESEGDTKKILSESLTVNNKKEDIPKEEKQHSQNLGIDEQGNPSGTGVGASVGEILSERENILNGLRMRQISDEIMQDTEDELNKFTRYARLFNLRNPRQLTRLRNSYRLLKNLHQDDDPMQLMFMLFLCEMVDSKYMQCSFKEDRVILDKKLFDDQPFITKLNEELVELNISNYNLLATKVRLCILPRHFTNKIEGNIKF